MTPKFGFNPATRINEDGIKCNRFGESNGEWNLEVVHIVRQADWACGFLEWNGLGRLSRSKVVVRERVA